MSPSSGWDPYEVWCSRVRAKTLMPAEVVAAEARRARRSASARKRHVLLGFSGLYVAIVTMLYNGRRTRSSQASEGT